MQPGVGSKGGGLPAYKGIEGNTDFLRYDHFCSGEREKLRCSFLNEAAFFKKDIDWQVPEKGRLWRYNLHYFQYLLSESGLDAGVGLSLIRDWLKKNPVGTPDAWDPFPLSLRLVCWAKFLFVTAAPGDELSEITRSMVEQTRWLTRHLEYHLLGNHLFKNGKALVFMGTCFAGSEAERWLQKGLEIIGKELDEQILDDGGHFERSPMYHSMILEDCLDLINILEEGEYRETLVKKAGEMVAFLAAMCHPDGQISLFNDAAFGIEAEPAELFAYYTRLTGMDVRRPVGGGGVNALPDSGYFVLSQDKKNKMIIDCGPVGPEYQPGHAHCDTLSFELSVKGKRVIVDSGCYQYVDGDIRRYNRGNIGHNTVTIDNQNQSEVWSAHRCGRKAQPVGVEWGETDGHFFFYGGHDGYKRLKGNPLHFRKVTQDDEGWLIHDTIQGQGIHAVESRLHVHPDMSVEVNGAEAVIRFREEVMLTVHTQPGTGIDVERGWYCPEFGIKKVCDVLVSKFRKVKLPFEGGWWLRLEH